MTYYKAPDNSLHFLDDADFLHLLPSGSMPITEEEAEALQPKPAGPSIQSQIDDLERAQLMPRATREFMLLWMEANNGTSVPGYAPLKAFDEQIKALRSQL
jgi:hypothetical protein